MQRGRFVLLTITLLALFSFSLPGFTQPARPDIDPQLRRDSVSPVEVVWNHLAGTASFARAEVPVTVLGLTSVTTPARVAQGFVSRYAALFGIGQVAAELQVTAVQNDDLGMHHVKLAQVYQGLPVYNSGVKVHIGPEQQLVALSSGFVPKIKIATTRPAYDATYALAAAHKLLPDGKVSLSPELVIYPFYRSTGARSDHLAWLVELADAATLIRQRYLVDAVTGTMIAVIDLQQDNRDRKTYDAEGGTSLPGTLKRSETDAATGDDDLDHAHDFAGATYDYFATTHDRDSFDDNGAPLISTVHYDQGFKNAFWNGEQMVYGDGMVVRDVVAHELTHAVTSHTANLEYRWQSGALNESFSDMFGAMVDREDWLIGEELPADVLGGQDAIRDMADPTRFGQPAHIDDWVMTCSDQEGVHTNSGITNKAYYLVAETIGKDKAERIFYRALTVYLNETSSLEDARAGALQSAQELYGTGSTEYTGTNQGFASVGLNGTFNPPSNDCTCAATTVFSDQSLYPNPLTMLNSAATLYRLRATVLTTTTAGQHYRALYEEHTGRVSTLLLRDAALREMAAEILNQAMPGLDHLVAGTGDQAVVTAELISTIQNFIQRLAARDRADGGNVLAQTIEREWAQVDFDSLVGMTYAEAWDAISRSQVRPAAYLPVLSR